MHTLYTIRPTAGRLRSALASWQWTGLTDKKPILVTSFADVFLRSRDGVWFLDTMAGTLTRVCATRRHLDKLLVTTEGKEQFLRASLIEQAVREGRKLGDGQCYDFRKQPILGGDYALGNLERLNFVVSLHVRGQMHHQLRHHVPGAPLAAYQPIDDPASPPWWKFW